MNINDWRPLPIKNISIRYKKTFRVNAARTWRQAIGQLLLNLLEWIDGRRMLAVEMSGAPDIPEEEHIRIMQAGLEHASRLLDEAIEAECTTLAMRIATPGLFEDGKVTHKTNDKSSRQ